MKILKLLPILFIAFNSIAQDVDYNKVIPVRSDENSTIEDKLVALAWKNYPDNRIAESNAVIANKEMNVAKWEWMDIFYANFNLNEGYINPDRVANNNIFFPLYNFGVRLSPSTFITSPMKSKAAVERYKISNLNVDKQKLSLRSEVLKRYYTYLSRIEILKVRVTALEETSTNFKVVSSKFKSGEITLEKFNANFLIQNNALEEKFRSEYDVKIAKANLEELIGIPLENVK